MLPDSLFPAAWEEQAVAAATLVVVAFLLGVGARSAMAKRIGKWFEDRMLTRFPPYVVVRSLARRLFGSDHPDELRPALCVGEHGVRRVCFIVEEMAAAKQAVIFVPLAPTPGVGYVEVADNDRLELIDASFNDAVGCLFNWGLGASGVVGNTRPMESADGET